MFPRTPFKYYWYKNIYKTPNIKMSDDLRAEFTLLAKRIKSVKSEEDFPVIKEAFDVLREKFVAEISKVNKKTIYTLEFKEFIFWGIYHLLETPAKVVEGTVRQRKKVSQATVAEIFGIAHNKFEKYDLYPMRSYKAYNKQDYISMYPFETDTEGIKIARLLNQKIIAPHACKRVITITNDLDVFANLEAPDNKRYIMVLPDTDDEGMRELAYCKYLFANGNNLVDDKGVSITAGKIKECILDILEMQDISVADGVLQKAFSQGENLSKYLNYGSSKVEEYLYCLEARDYFSQFIDDTTLAEDFYNLPYEEFRKNTANIPEDELYGVLRDKAENRAAYLYTDILDGFDIKRYLSDSQVTFSEYMGLMIDSVFNSGNDDVKRKVALFWLIEANAHEDNRGMLIDWLKSSSLLRYIDTINQEVCKSVKKSGSGVNRVQEHLKLISNSIDWNELLGKVTFDRPNLVYIDKSSYDIGVEEFSKLTARQDCILVVRDESGKVTIHLKEIGK